MSDLRRLAKVVLPPIVQHHLRGWMGPLRWTGHHPDWATAARRCRGYDDQGILDQVEAAVRQVLAGRARYERDGVLFHDGEQRWPVLAAAGLARARCGHLRTLDVGGSLGTVWLQHRAWLHRMGADWRIVEQPAFVARGRALFAGLALTFHDSIAAACADGPPALAVLEGVLPYVEDPAGLLAAVVAQRPAVILIDHTVVQDADHDRIAIQRVVHAIHPASYPCRIFSRAAIPRLVGPAYELVGDITNDYRPPGVIFAGWVFARRDGPGGGAP